MKKTIIVMAALTLAGCEGSGDPADGGFLAGISGISGGGYQARVDQQQAALDQEQATAAALEAQRAQLAQNSADVAAEITRLRGVHTQLRLDISAKVAALRASGVTLTSTMTQRVNAVVNNSPTGSSDAARLAALQTAIADARALSSDLARLS